MKIIDGFKSKGALPVDDYIRSKLIESAKSYLGTPFQHMGRNKFGLDCAGLILVVVNDVMGTKIEVKDYTNWPNQIQMREICKHFLLRNMEPSPGDVVLSMASGYGVVHLGWFTGTTMIHASNEIDVNRVVENHVTRKMMYGIFSVPRYEI